MYNTLMKKAVFMDRDGIINELVYNPEFGTIDSPLNPKQVVLNFGIIELLKSVLKKGFTGVIISNQPSIGLGKTTLKNHQKIINKIQQKLKKKEVRVDSQFYCFHHPFAKLKRYKKVCNCRKPAIGLFEIAVKELNIDLSKSWMIGDGVDDVIAGEKMGCKTILLANISASENLRIIEKQLGKIKPDFIIKKLVDAIDIIK